MSHRNRRLAAFAAAAAATAVAFVPLAASPAAASPAAAVDTGERITDYRAELRIEPDGTLDVRETIKYDFGAATRHGIYRRIPVRFRQDDTHDRVYEIHDMRVTSPSGAPAEVDRSESDGEQVLRIGDPDSTVTGRETYVIDYAVDGALNPFADHVELYWNALAAGDGVSIEAGSATVSAPADVTRVACYAGPKGTRTPCAGATKDGGTASFASGPLGSGGQLTVVVALPQGSVPAKPILVTHPSWRTDYGPGVANIAATLVVAGVGAVLLVLLRRRRRQSTPEQTGPVPAYALGPRPGAIRVHGDTAELAPPGGLRPGEVGTLVDESADTVDVTATIFDLAARGYLVIDELGDDDWGLRMLRPPGQELLPYERAFFDALFLGKPDRVRLSALRNHFASSLGRIKDLMYEDMARRGWFAVRRPDRVKRVWRVAGGVAIVVGGLATFSIAVQAAHAPFGLGALALLLLGVGVVVGARWIPGRSTAGTAALSDVLAFREELAALDFATLPEGSRDEIVSRTLPYAIAFGLTSRWTAAFDQMAARPGRPWAYRPYWYRMHHGWSPAAFSAAVSSFATSSGGVLAATPGSSGSSGFSSGSSGGGFAGGGGGGGSVGSW